MSQLQHETKQLITPLMPDVFDLMHNVKRVALWLFDCVAVNVFTVIRSEFGERFMSFINWFIGASMFSTFVLFAALAGSPRTMLWRLVWGPLVFVCFLYHRWRIRKRNRAGIHWHSQSDGVSHLLKIPFIRNFVPTEVVVKWLEPALVLLFAWPISYLDRGLGVYFVIVGVALCLRAQVNYNLQREQYLIERDRRIEAAYLAAAVSGRPVTETAGFTIAESNRHLVREESAALLAQGDPPRFA